MKRNSKYRIKRLQYTLTFLIRIPHQKSYINNVLKMHQCL